jgi:hypothetical protein
MEALDSSYWRYVGYKKLHHLSFKEIADNHDTYRLELEQQIKNKKIDKAFDDMLTNYD